MKQLDGFGHRKVRSSNQQQCQFLIEKHGTAVVPMVVAMVVAVPVVWVLLVAIVVAVEGNSGDIAGCLVTLDTGDPMLPNPD